MKFVKTLSCIAALVASQHAFSMSCTGTYNNSPNNICTDIVPSDVYGTDVTFKVFQSEFRQMPSQSMSDYNWFINDVLVASGTHELHIDLPPATYTVRAVHAVGPGTVFSDTEVFTSREKFCDNELPSVPERTDMVTVLNFSNHSNEPIFLYWSDTSTGKREQYAKLYPGQSYPAQGYPGYRWVIGDQHENCAAVYANDYYNRDMPIVLN